MSRIAEPCALSMRSDGDEVGPNRAGRKCLVQGAAARALHKLRIARRVGRLTPHARPLHGVARRAVDHIHRERFADLDGSSWASELQKFVCV